MKSRPRSPKPAKSPASASNLMKTPRAIAAGILVFVLGLVFAGGLSFTPWFEPPAAPATVDTVKLAAYLQETSVLVVAKDSTGSGTIFSRKEADGRKVHFVWTAAHVVDSHRKATLMVQPDGSLKQKVEFETVKVEIRRVKNGRVVLVYQIPASIIQYSAYLHGEDLAVLRLHMDDYKHVDTEFMLDAWIPPIGTDVFTVGSPLGRMGQNTFSIGVVNQHAREIYGRLFDQTSTIVYGGSSGSGVFLSDGRYMGMLTMMTVPQMGYVIPVRRIHAWAKRAKIEWALDRRAALPSEVALAKLPPENDGCGQMVPFPRPPARTTLPPDDSCDQGPRCH